MKLEVDDSLRTQGEKSKDSELLQSSLCPSNHLTHVLTSPKGHVMGNK